MVKRNLFLAYIAAFCKNTWFWLGIWIFYYLKFTNYAGIGIIETVLVVTYTVSEIPTGAIADLLGKKKTLLLAFLFEALGAFMMAFTPNFQMLAASVFVMCVGGALYSGTLEALVYDTLKQHGKQKQYQKIISNISTISLIAPAVCGALGGFIYNIDPRFPFIANGVFYSLGIIVCFFLTEPSVDTVKFSFSSFFRQTRQGLKQLFKTRVSTNQTVLLLSIGFFVVIASEMLNSFLGAEFGFSAQKLGILWSAIFLVSAVASQATPFIVKIFRKRSVLVVGFVIAISFIVSPYIGLILGGISLALRSSLESIFGNLTSTMINENTESKYRATTISTFNMIKNTPYILAAYFIGVLSDTFSAKTISFYLGIFLLTLLATQLFIRRGSLLTTKRL